MNSNRKSEEEKYLVVISYDAFSADNWQLASQLPNLSKLIKNGAYSTQLKSVYPTLTYVIHSTYVTGVYPNKHGVFHNNPLQPFVEEENQRWFWFRNDIKVPTIYDELAKRGLKTASLLWPVSGKAPIQYNIPEIRAINNENQALKILKNGSPLYSIDMELKYGKLRKGIQQPYLDDFTTKCAVDTIKRKKPNLLLMHLIDLDDAKHANGIDSPYIDEVVKRMDDRIGEIVDAVDAAGIREQTTFIVVGDHGQKNVRYKVHLNALLKEHGLIYEEQGEMKWRAYVQGAGGAAYLHVREGDAEAERLAIELLEKEMHKDSSGIESILDRAAMESMKAGSNASYMLEAKLGYCFEDGWNKPIIVDLEEKGMKYATHGYSPDKPDYKSVFVASGNGIKSGVQLGDIEVVDVAPTIAKILGIDFVDCDGRALDEIFEA